MAVFTPFVAPPNPDPSTLKNPPPFAPFPITHLRAGTIRPVFNKAGMTSGIYKQAQPFPVHITTSGVPGDEHAYEPHRDADKAVHHYSAAHYASWAAEIPECAHLFKPGAFGENIFSTELDERKVCIGDKIRMGGALLEVSEPRSPCYKLNHRFQTRDMATRVQTLLRSGWLYRVLEEGLVNEGDVVELVERPHPEWTVARVAYYMFLDRMDVEMMREMVELKELGHEIRDRFQMRLDKGDSEGTAMRLVGPKEEMMDTWNEFKVVEKRRETSVVSAFTFEAVGLEDEQAEPVKPGSHVRIKLGGKLVRAYSVVGGTTKRFEIGVALDPESRGGSKYLHESTNVGDVLTVSRITSSFPLVETADRHVLIAGGISITAFLSAVQHLRSTGQKYELHFAVSQEVPFAAQVEALGSDVKIYSKAKGERLDLKAVMLRADPTTHIYCCGPERLMDAVAASAKDAGVPDSSVHFEQFIVTTSGDPFTAELKQSGKTVEVGPTQTLLDALREVGMSVASSCEVGNCGSCRVELCSGRVEHKGTGLLDEEKGEAMLSCVSRGVGRIVLDL